MADSQAGKRGVWQLQLANDPIIKSARSLPSIDLGHLTGLLPILAITSMDLLLGGAYKGHQEATGDADASLNSDPVFLQLDVPAIRFVRNIFEGIRTLRASSAFVIDLPVAEPIFSFSTDPKHTHPSMYRPWPC